MASCIKLKNHKGIKTVKLNGLGHINVFCGKNNSGKTSLMEAMGTSDKCSLGRLIDMEGANEFVEIFDPLARRYTDPIPQNSLAWFRAAILNKENTIIFHDEVDLLAQEFGKSYHKSTNRGPGTFNFSVVFNQYIQNNTQSFKPVLIHPKRELNSKSLVQKIGDPPQTNGVRILNRLFTLSTQNNRDSGYKIYQALKEAFYEISGGFHFHINVNQQNEIVLQFSAGESTWIFAEDSGLGLRDILVILSYLLDSDFSAIVIEEPENHIHPDMQRRLLRFISTVPDKQIFITTHSNVFLDPTYIDKIFYVEFENDEVVVSDETSRSNILSNLGYSVIDNLVADLIVLTEGPTDIPIIKEICNKLDFLHKFGVKFYPLGGDMMHHVDLSVFKEKSIVMAIVDSDPGSKKIRDEFVQKCEDNKIPVKKLDRYAIENYFSIRAIRRVYPHQPIPTEIIELETNKKIKEQIGFDVKSMGLKIVQEMTLEEFAGTDLLDFCKSIHEALLKL